MPPHLARVFLVPERADRVFPWRKGNLDITQRLRRYPRGSGDEAVDAIRAVQQACPTRRRAGYAERWQVVVDQRTPTGDVLWYRRRLTSADPTGFDRGSDWIVVRHRDVVTLVEMRHGRAAPGRAGAQLLEAVRQETCPGGRC